jgi:hypothetical protein
VARKDEIGGKADIFKLLKRFGSGGIYTKKVQRHEGHEGYT